MALLDTEICVRITKNNNVDLLSKSLQARNLHLLLELQHLPGMSQELSLQITDDQDPLLLFSSILSENDYHILKSSQGLLVDFVAFPHHFCDLIKFCSNERNKETPKFMLVLRTNCEDDLANYASSGVTTNRHILFEVIEINTFKHLCHLSVSLTPASLHTKLSHLSTHIKKLKSSHNLEHQKYNQVVCHLEQEVSQLKQALAFREAESEKTKEELGQRFVAAKEEHARRLSQEKGKVLKVQSDSDRKYARERRDLENQYKEQIEELTKKKKFLNEKNRELSNMKQELEISLKEFKRKCASNEEELRRQKEDLFRLKKIRAELEHSLGSQENTIKTLLREKEHLIAEVKSKDSMLYKTSEELAVRKQDLTLLKANYNAAEEKLKKREASLQQVFTDLQKSLDVIRKFQQREKENLSVIDKYSGTCSELETQCREKERELKELQLQNKELTSDLLSRDKHAEDHTRQFSEAKEKIAEQENALQRNEHIISWLNKQLNEAESTGALMKKAPLTEAYMIHQNPPHLLPNFNTSTPNGNLPAPAAGVSVYTTFGSKEIQETPALSSVSESHNIPKISEELTPVQRDQDENKENTDGLPRKYIEPVRKSNSFPVRGLLRKNAVKKTSSVEGAGPKNLLATKNTVSSRGRGQKKVTIKEPLSYFPS